MEKSNKTGVTAAVECGRRAVLRAGLAGAGLAGAGSAVFGDVRAGRTDAGPVDGSIASGRRCGEPGHGWTSVSNRIRFVEDDGVDRFTAGHSLQYLGCTWNPYGDPDPDGRGDSGAWKLTFAMNSTAFYLYRPEVVGNDRGDEQAWVPAVGRRFDRTGITVRVLDEGETSPKLHDERGRRTPTNPDAVAVSARRDPDLYAFAGGRGESEELTYLMRDVPELGRAIATLPRHRGDYRPRNVARPVDRSDGWRARLDDAESGDGLDHGATFLTAAIALYTELRDSAFSKVLSKGLLLLDVAEVLATFVNDDVVAPDVDFDRGFEHVETFGGGTHSAVAGHWLVFDAYVADASRTTVRAESHYASSGWNPSRRWDLVVDTQGEVPTVRSWGADRTDRDRGDDGEFEPGPAVWREPPKPGFRPTRRTFSAGETVTFDASATILGSSPVVAYHWMVAPQASGGDVHTFRGAEYTHTFETAGTHEVTLKTVAADGLNASVTEERYVDGGERPGDDGVVSNTRGGDRAGEQLANRVPRRDAALAPPGRGGGR